MHIIVVIPTYNERENIYHLIKRILTIGTYPHILVVDDNSPDGTGEVVAELTLQCPKVHLLRRKDKRGYASACLDGFRWALAHNASIILSMDADGSHDPKYIPELLSAIQDCDMVIGSRYLTGISVVNWPLRRLLLSLLANRYIRLLLGFPITDSTSGFRAYTAATLKRILPKKATTSGYALLVETLFYVSRQRLQIREIPIIFTERRKGKSKMSWQIIWESIWLPWKLNFYGKFLPNRGLKRVTK